MMIKSIKHNIIGPSTISGLKKVILTAKVELETWGPNH